MKKVYNYDFVKMEYSMVSTAELLEQAGLNDDGAIQTFFTGDVLRYILPYMPYASGTLMKLTILQTDISKPWIVTRAPQAHYLWNGKVWVDPVLKAAGFFDEKSGQWYSRKGVAKVETDRDLTYNTEKNEKAGPKWNERMVAERGKDLQRNLQGYIDQLARRNK